MGDFVMPKHTGLLREFTVPLKVCYEKRNENEGWMSNGHATRKEKGFTYYIFEEYKRLGVENVPKKDNSDYTKDAQIPLYLGFMEGRGHNNTEKRLTPQGIKMHEAIEAGNINAQYELLINAFEKMTFGRNNQGFPSADSDVEVPNVLLLSSIFLDGVTRQEFYCILFLMHTKGYDLARAVAEIIYFRKSGENIPEIPNIYTDCKLIPLFVSMDFLTEDAQKRLHIATSVYNHFAKRILHLKSKNEEVINAESNQGNGDEEEIDINPVIYYGAPGTGKTRYVQEEIYAKFPDAYRVFTTFHQSYSYEDFVEGLKPILDENSEDVKYHIEPGVFYIACEKAAMLAGYDSLEDCIADTSEGRADKFHAAKLANKTILLCIDEINRGNVASIFGDLISLIEPSKRLGAGTYEMIAKLPYSKTLFGVPSNLFIVGTMNTADRSIQLLDSALRRRFRFNEMIPDYSVFKILDGTASKVLKCINARIRSILNKDNQIGHSYLMNAETNKEIVTALISKIIPLLEEYFYNEIRKVRFVLNEDDNTKYPFYIEDKEAKEAYQSYLAIEDIDEEDKSFYTIDKSIADLTEEECGKYLKHLLGEKELEEKKLGNGELGESE